MNVLMIEDSYDAWGCSEEDAGWYVTRTSLGCIAMNGIWNPTRFDLVMVCDFDLDAHRADAALLRGQLREGVPIVRVDRV